MPANRNETDKALRIVFGPVAIVRAIPSREVSVVNIEVPEDFHVEVTNLLYGQDCLITLANLTGATYGVMEPDQVAEKTNQPQTEAAARITAIHGRVAGVKSLASRGISVISVEVPEDFHVEITQMVYGRDVLIMPVKMTAPTPYGVTKGAGQVCSSTVNPKAGTAAPSRVPKAMQMSAALRRQGITGTGGGMIRLPAPMNITRWLGSKCNDESFQEFLEVISAEQAAERVRELCGVESRKDIADDATARAAFMTRIYQPYIASTSGSHPS